MRIHPAAGRVQKLAQLTPSTYMVFDLLVDEKGKSLVGQPLAQRRNDLRRFIKQYVKTKRVRLSPFSDVLRQAEGWMKNVAGIGFDGVVAKRNDLPYLSGERTGVVKVKRLRTADCVVGGFRYDQKGKEVGSLLLGLYNDQGRLDHVGFTSAFNQADRKKLREVLKPYRGGAGFSGKSPGGPSRWASVLESGNRSIHNS